MRITRTMSKNLIPLHMVVVGLNGIDVREPG